MKKLTVNKTTKERWTMKTIIYLIGPSVLIYIGLALLESVPYTFLLFYSWLFFIPLVTYLRKNEIKTIIQCLRNGITFKSIYLGVASGVLSLIVIFISVSFAQHHIFEIDQLKDLLIKWQFSGTSVGGLIFVLLIINPFLEEMYWREFMHVKLLSQYSGVKTILITSFFYSLYHLIPLGFMFEIPYSLIGTIAVFSAGLLWGYFRLIFKSLVAPIISHAFSDLGIILIYLYYFM